MNDRALKILLFGKNFNKEDSFEKILNKIQARYHKCLIEALPEINQKHSTLRSTSAFFPRKQTKA